MSWDRSYTAILGVAGLLRLAWAAWIPIFPVSDGIAYETFARNLAIGGAFGWDPAVPDAFWPPGAPFLYSLFLRAFGPGLESIVIGNVVMSLAVVWLTMRLVHSWEGPEVARVAGWILACWPLQIQLVTVLASELPFTVAMLGALVVVGHRLPTLAETVMAGVLLAAASYLRPTALLLPGGIALIALWRRAPPAAVAVRTVGAVAVMALLIAPWTLRNQEVFGRFVPISANAGANLWMGNNPESVGEYMPVPPELKSLDRASQDAILRDRALEWMTAEPGAALALMVRKLWVTHGRETIGTAWNREGLRSVGWGERSRRILAAGSTAYWYAVLVLGLIGGFVALRRDGLGSVPVVFWIYFAAVHAITVAMDRYHLPSVPFIAWLSAMACLHVRTALEARWGAAEAP